MRRTLLLLSMTLLSGSAIPVTAQEPTTDPGPPIGVWESGGLSESTLATVELVASFHGADFTVIDAGTLRMLSVMRQDVDVQRPAPGYGYPMSVAVYHLDSYRSHLPAEISAALESGGVVMSERSALLRGAMVGDVIEMEGWNDEIVSVPIALIAADADIDFVEIVISGPLADRLGLDRPSWVRMWSSRPGEIATLLDTLIADTDPVRIYDPATALAGIDQPLSTVAIKERFGEFAFRPRPGGKIDIEEAWEEANIVTVTVPRLGLFECHRKMVPYVRAALAQVEREGLYGELDPDDFQAAGGCFNSRLMKGGDKGFALSRHAWGVAFDLNPSTNRYGEEVTLHPRIGQIFRDWGFAWGAGWTVPDGMHFEWVGPPSEAAVPTCSSQVLVPSGDTQAGWGVYSREGDCG